MAGILPVVDAALRAQAHRDGKSLNEAAIEAFDATIAEQHQLDEFPWR